jgi:hypothetical protein
MNVRCEVCGHVFSERHHLKLRSWGGTDDDGLARLCPNHHSAVHLLIKWYLRKPLSPNESEQLEVYYNEEPALMRYFFAQVKPFVVARRVEEGTWYP